MRIFPRINDFVDRWIDTGEASTRTLDTVAGAIWVVGFCVVLLTIAACVYLARRSV